MLIITKNISIKNSVLDEFNVKLTADGYYNIMVSSSSDVHQNFGVNGNLIFRGSGHSCLY